MKKTQSDIINYLKNNAAVKDSIILLLAGAFLFLISLRFDIYDVLKYWYEGNVFWGLDDLFVAMLILAVSLVIFSWRRYKELENEILERKKAVRKMEQSRAQLQAVLDGVPDIILQVDNQMRIIWANKTAILKNPNCISQICRVAFSNIEGLSIETYCKWAMETKKIEKGIRFQPAKGHIGGDKYWEGIGVPLVLSDGRVIGAIAIARNVTDHMQVEATRKMLASIVESSDDAIIGENLDGKINSWNSGAERIFGYLAMNAIGKNSVDLIFQDIKEQIPVIREMLKKGKSIENIHIKYRKQNGEPLYIAMTVSPIIHPTNNIVGYSTIARDITAQKKAEDALIASETKYRNLFEYSLEGIGITQGDKFISANKTLLSIFGYENLEEFIGKSILDYATPESRDIITERLIKRAYGEELSPRYEIQIIRKDGEKRYLEISAGTLLIGEELYIQSTFRDITLKKTADDELKRSREQLRNLATHLEKVRETERKEIAYEIHDDLGQCLTAMKMDISWIGKKLEKSQKTLHERANSMSELIDDTINKVRMISTQLRPSILDHFGIAAAIEWIGEDFQKRTDISCKITIEPKDIELDEFTSTGVFRICQEALTNITRHAQATTVDISLIKNNGTLELKVVDDGIGIDEESVNDVHSFGLIGIRERAYLAGGTSSIVGKPNEGTTVTVQIPIINNGEQDD